MISQVEGEFSELRAKAVEFMQGRDWKRKTGKQKHGVNQSLFDHTLVVLDSLIAILPLLRQTFVPKLTDEEERLVLVSAIAHDVGKELEEWQSYVRGERKFLSDVNRRVAQEIVPQIAHLLSSDQQGTDVTNVVNEILSGVLLHMKHERTPANVMDRVLFGEHVNMRWRTLAELVVVGDNLASAKGVFEGLQCLERCSVSNHLRTSYHLVQFRGVSTTLLHKAAIDAYQNSGWSAVMHYSAGTIYATSSNVSMDVPRPELIAQGLSEAIASSMPCNIASLVVGNPTASMIPKKDLFDYRDLRECLRVAARRVRRGNFLKKPEVDRRKVVATYLTQKGSCIELTNEMLSVESTRISNAHPEICIFKFFKASLDNELLGDVISDETKSAYRKSGLISESLAEKISPADIARIEFDRVFGEDSFSDLMETSTLMPARDMALTVDRFWALPGSHFALNTKEVELVIDHSKRELALIETLGTIADKVYNAIPEHLRPVRASSHQIASSFIADLIYPQDSAMYPDANQLLVAYGETKRNARRASKSHICPICNSYFVGGTNAKADFVANPESHSNRAIAHGSGGYIVICDACKFERFLQQLLLGNKVENIIVLFPRMNIGPSGGELLRRKASSIWDIALNRMSDANPMPDQQVTLALTQCLAKNLVDLSAFRLGASEIVDVLTYESSTDTKKKHRKQLESELKELYDVETLTVELLNEMWVTQFSSLEEAMERLVAGVVTDDDARKARATAFRLTPQLRICCQTPHMIFIPLTNPVSLNADSDANAGLRELYITLLLGMSLDCSVATLKVGETVTFTGGEGVARVPPVPALRELVGSDWISVDKAELWLDAIGAAALLAPSTKLPERSNLLAILCSPTPGHILRRIEQKSDSGYANGQQILLLEKIRKVMR